MIGNDESRDEDPLYQPDSDEEPEENPFTKRVIGLHKKTTENMKTKPIHAKKKCQKCNKGFNCNSRYKICHLCDKLQHVDCISNHNNKEEFKCIKCLAKFNYNNISEDTEEHDSMQIKLSKITDNLLNIELNDVELVNNLIDSTKLDLNVSLLSKVPNFGQSVRKLRNRPGKLGEIAKDIVETLRKKTHIEFLDPLMKHIADSGLPYTPRSPTRSYKCSWSQWFYALFHCHSFNHSHVSRFNIHRSDDECWYDAIVDQIVLHDLPDLPRDLVALRKLMVDSNPSLP